VFIIPHTIWARRLLQTSKSASMKRVIERNAILLGVVGLSVMALSIESTQAFISDTPWTHYALGGVLGPLLDIAFYTGICFFLESYARSHRTVTYRQGWCGDVKGVQTKATGRTGTGTAPASISEVGREPSSPVSTASTVNGTVATRTGESASLETQ